MLDFFKKKQYYMDWDDYKDKITFIDTFHWQQRIRNQNMKKA